MKKILGYFLSNPSWEAKAVAITASWDVGVCGIEDDTKGDEEGRQGMPPPLERHVSRPSEYWEKRSFGVPGVLRAKQSKMGGVSRQQGTTLA